MSKQYYDSALTGAEIDKALKAVSDLVTQNNNGKILTIENGKFAAKKPAEIAGTAVLEALNVSENRDYYPESGVDGYNEVHVTVPSYPEPTGTIQISSNGTVNVKDYASAEVNVPSGITVADEGKVVSNGALVAQTARATEITQNGTVDTTLNNSVTVNISGGGSPTLQSKTVTPSASQQTVQPDSGYDGLSSVVVNGDADLVAGNIKKNVEIFGVTGSYEGSGGGGSNLVEAWDFTVSEFGSEKHIEAAFNRITRDSNGALLNGVKGYIGVSPVTQGFSVEVDISTLGAATTKRLLGESNNYSHGLYYNGTTWTFVTANGTEDIGITDPDYFNNSTLKIRFGNDGKWYIYKNNTLIYTTIDVLIPKYTVYIGTTTTGGMTQALITGIRIING